MMFTAKIEDKTVVASGSLLLDGGQHKWTLEANGLVFNFIFTQKGDGPPSLHLESSNQRESTVLLVNWNNSLGSSYVIREFATLAGKNFTLGFYVESIGSGEDCARNVNYCITES